MRTPSTIQARRAFRAATARKLALLLALMLLLAESVQALGSTAQAAPAQVRSGRLHAADIALHSTTSAHPAGQANTPQAADSTLHGQVVNPDGSPFTSTSLTAGVSAISFDGFYNFEYLDSSGAFSMPLEAGIYEISIWLDSASNPSVGSPSPFYVSVSGDTPIGDIALVSRDVTISGNVSSSGSPPIGMLISAWDAQGVQYSAVTDTSGHYSISVTSGTWQVAPDLQFNTGYIFSGAPEIRQLDSGQSATVNFSVQATAGTISGSISDASTSAPVTAIDGWAYVRIVGGDILSWAPINNGSFTLPAPSLPTPSDEMAVGLFLDQNSNYSIVDEILVDKSTGSPFAVDIPVQAHNATIDGVVYLIDDLSHTPVTGVSGLVVLTDLDDPSTTPITKYEPIDPATGTYTVDVLPGNWLVSYQLLTDTFQADLSTPLLVQAVGGQSTTLDLPLVSNDGFVTVEVTDEDGVPQPNVTVWVRYGTQEVYGETDTEGLATIYVPYTTSEQANRVISPQGPPQPPLTIGTSYSSCKKSNKPSTGSSKCKNSSLVVAQAPKPKPKPRAGGLLAAVVDAPVALALRNTNSALSGRVLGTDGQTARSDAFISAWSADGQWISGVSGLDGTFSLPIVQDSTISTTWQLSASYWDAGAKKLLNERKTVVVNVGRDPATPIAAGDLALKEITSTLPPSESQRFSNSAGLTLLLSDGTLIQIPENAMPDGFGSDIRITVDPQIALPSTDLNRLARYYGYSINLYDAQTGRPIDQPLKSPATISFQYTLAQLQQLGISENDLQPAQFADDVWHVADGFLQDRQGEHRTISLKTKTLDSWALVAEQKVVAQEGGARIYMPLIAK
ncbi:MAG TPA: hypothetical protein VFU22_18300 [Roseiflexaceae bacterium]|nr:hypothetical protein [Roseiflexaceae bacterium]